MLTKTAVVEVESEDSGQMEGDVSLRTCHCLLSCPPTTAAVVETSLQLQVWITVQPGLGWSKHVAEYTRFVHVAVLLMSAGADMLCKMSRNKTSFAMLPSSLIFK